MSITDSVQSIASNLLAQKSLTLQSWQPIQTLWAGYGQICSVLAIPIPSPLQPTSTCPVPAPQTITSTTETQSWILKYIAPPSRSRANDEGHIRKILSYNVEQYFYTNLAPQLPGDIPVATCLASIKESTATLPSGAKRDENVTAMLLTDLRLGFPIAGEKQRSLNEVQIRSAVDWLASFHGFWWERGSSFEKQELVRPPLEEIKRNGELTASSVWLNGGYTYLATRRNEYASLCSDEDSEWSELLCASSSGGMSIAEKVAKVLETASDNSAASILFEYQTLIHGDVKSENLFTSHSGDQVVFYDFQYVGIGLGVCDLAKLFTCSVPLWMLVENEYVPDELDLQQGEEKLLRQYQRTIERRSLKKYPWEALLLHWETALVDWLRFQASWGFWGNSEWLEARVRFILSKESWRNRVDEQVGQ